MLRLDKKIEGAAGAERRQAPHITREPRVELQVLELLSLVDVNHIGAELLEHRPDVLRDLRLELLEF